MEDWKGVIAQLAYLLQFRSDPVGAIPALCKSILSGDAVADSPEEILTAIERALASREDLATVIPQPHSDEILRKVLAGLQMILKMELRRAAPASR